MARERHDITVMVSGVWIVRVHALIYIDAVLKSECLRNTFKPMSSLQRSLVNPLKRSHRIIQRPVSLRFYAMQNDKGQGVSHAKDSSVPRKIQEQAPSKLEHELPDSVHDTGSNKETGKESHAVGDSKVPQALQEALPESVEKAVPNAIHDTGKK